jgi:hypothetical protein
MHWLVTPTLTMSVLRSFTRTFVVLMLLVVALMQGAPGATVTDAAESPGSSPAQPLWKAEYSRDYPGCVSMLLWPTDEVPVAFLTRSASGEVARVSVESLALLSAEQNASPLAIGACR